VAIKAGQILHAMNQFIVDRIQSGGAGNLNIPQERVYELGNYQSVGIVRDVPDLSFSLDVLDVGTQVEALLCGAVRPDDDAAHPLGDGNTVDGALYDLSTASTVDIISPFKSSQGAFNIVKGVAVPQLSLEQAQYRYGLRQNAGEQFTLRGDSIYYTPGIPFLVTYDGDGSTTAFNFATTAGATLTNEVQTVTISGTPAGGTFTLTFGGQTTAGIAFNAPATAVKSALAALTTIGTGNVDVTGSTGGPYSVTFQGTFAGVDVAQMTASGAGLTGGSSPSVAVTTATQGSTVLKALKALTYTESGATFHALNVSVNGVRQNKDTDYTDSVTAVTFTTAPANGAKIRIVFGSNKDATNADISVNYTQAVNADLSVKPAAIRGKDIKVYVGGLGDSFKWHDVQSVEVDWRVNLDADYEFGNAHAVNRDFVDAPDVSGTIEIKSITVDKLFEKLNQITGVNAADVVGPQSSVTLPIVVQLLNPDSGGTSHVARGTVLKTLFIPDARFVIPGYEGRVSQKVMSQLQFTSDKGILKVVKGAATATQLGL
jgi:hypothetical protein